MAKEYVPHNATRILIFMRKFSVLMMGCIGSIIFLYPLKQLEISFHLLESSLVAFIIILLFLVYISSTLLLQLILDTYLVVIMNGILCPANLLNWLFFSNRLCEMLQAFCKFNWAICEHRLFSLSSSNLDLI